MRIRVAVAVLLALAAATAATAADTPYAKRLQIAEALAIRYPGQVERGSALGSYGLWAGIVVQTAWQQRSHRDRIGLWSAVNLHLSVEPTTYARLLEHADSRDPGVICRSTATPQVCEDWVRYLVGAKRHLPASTLQALLWTAHSTAIATALRRQRRLFDSVRTTTLERNFWLSWVEVVFLLQASRFPTGAATSERASQLLMPPCSPLGSPGCGLSVLDLGPAFPFVSALALRPASIDRALAEYRLLQAGRPAPTDPALALALRLYLAVAR